MKQSIIFLTIIMAAILFTGCGNNNTDTVTSEIEQQNKAIVERIHEEASKGNLSVYKEYLSANYVRHCQAMAPEYQELHGTKQFLAFLGDFYNAIPNAKDSIEVMLAEGDKVAYVMRTSGKQTGQMGNLPPSNKDFELVSIIIHRFEKGKIIESWVSWDNIAMLSQLGYFPPTN